VSRCEWNPVYARASTNPPSDGDCPNEVTVCVGANGRWHLCTSCAAMKPFLRLKQYPLSRTTMSTDSRDILIGTAGAYRVLQKPGTHYIRIEVDKTRDVYLLTREAEQLIAMVATAVAR